MDNQNNTEQPKKRSSKPIVNRRARSSAQSAAEAEAASKAKAAAEAKAAAKAAEEAERDLNNKLDKITGAEKNAQKAKEAARRRAELDKKREEEEEKKKQEKEKAKQHKEAEKKANRVLVKDPPNAFLLSIDRSMRRKRRILIALLVILAAVIALVVAVSVNLSRKNKIATAKSVISQLDIQTTFKDPEFPDDGDWDNDGITNIRENDTNTGIQNEDTDGDGIKDGDELELGTDPLKEDTDGDGLLDGYEIMAGTNPRMTSTNGSVPDAQLEVSVKKTDGDCTVTLTGNANIAGSTVEELDLFGISANASVVSKAYDFYTDYPFSSAEIKINVDSTRLSKSGYSLKDLTVLKFDASTLEYTTVESKTDSSGKSVSAEITESGTYVVGAEKTVNDPATTRVAFLIDNSGSMYPKELCPTSSENDVDFKRIDFTQSLIDRFDLNYQIGISKFTATYTEMVSFTDDRAELKKALRSIKEGDEFFNGTHNQEALRKCIESFNNESSGKYRNIIVMLSDGESDEEDPESIEELAELAGDKSVIVLTVGLGRDIDRNWLQNIAYQTGGKYYSASDANALEDVYKQIVTTLNYDIVTYNDSNDEVSGYSLYNTGFEPSRNGFAFKNFRTTTTASVDFGMAVLARDWYLGSVQMKLGDIEPADDSTQKVSAKGYDLTDTDAGKAYEDRQPLNSISTTLFTHKYTKVQDYLDFTSSGNNLRIKKDYKYDAENKGWAVDKTKIDAGNLSWHYVELLDLDIANGLEKIAKGYGDSDAQLAAALYRLNVLQWDDKEYEYSLTKGDEGFKELERQLSLGIPVVTTIDDTHTVNTIALIRDSSCHRKYILRVYDNNYPGKVKELYLEKKPVADLTVTNGTATFNSQTFTYVATYEGKQVGIAFSDVGEH